MEKENKNIIGNEKTIQNSTNETKGVAIMDKSTLLSISKPLKIIGYIVMGLGIIAGIIIFASVADDLSEPAYGFFAGLMVAFYHCMFGMLCLGVAALLELKVVGGSAATATIKNISKCSKCGKEYSEGFSGEFCEECGERVNII